VIAENSLECTREREFMKERGNSLKRDNSLKRENSQKRILENSLGREFIGVNLRERIR